MQEYLFELLTIYNLPTRENYAVLDLESRGIFNFERGLY